MTNLGPLVRVRAAMPLKAFHVKVSFEDGTEKVVDLLPYLRGPIFESIRSEPVVFRSLRVEGGAITWPNGADIDPDVLYYDLKPAWDEKQPA